MVGYGRSRVASIDLIFKQTSIVFGVELRVELKCVQI